MRAMASPVGAHGRRPVGAGCSAGPGEPLGPFAFVFCGSDLGYCHCLNFLFFIFVLVSMFS